jgi:hypothetical protein
MWGYIMFAWEGGQYDMVVYTNVSMAESGRRGYGLECDGVTFEVRYTDSCR